MRHLEANTLLQRLDPETLRELAPSLAETDLKQGQILTEPYNHVRVVYFPPGPPCL